MALETSKKGWEAHMPKWTDIYLLWIGQESDNKVAKPAKAFARKYNLDIHHKLSDQNPPPTGWTWMDPEQNMLSAVGPDDKLLIFGHGYTDTVGESATVKTAREFGRYLKDNGLMQAGLISFHSCLTGREHFLFDFEFHCRRRGGMNIGWVKGYRGLTTLIDDGGFSVYERILDWHSNGVKHGDDRTRIVRGNVDIHKGGRYSTRPLR
jgi:hypothetical protein